MTLPAGFRLGLPEGLTWERGERGLAGWWFITDEKYGITHARHLGAVTEEGLANVWDPSFMVRSMVERAVGSSAR